MDATAIALVRSNPASDADADAFVNRYMATMMPGGSNDPTLHMKAFNAIEVAGGYRVVSDGYMDTAFMPVVGISDMPLDLATEVRMTGGKYEVALALDNTGSMRNFGRIGRFAMPPAAVDDSIARRAPRTASRFAVPFVTAVKYGTRMLRPANVIDPVGADPVFHGTS